MECGSSYVLSVLIFKTRLSGTHPYDGDDDELGT